ncbi:MAG: peptidylprolyl isomerase [Bacteroidales bacterium]|nr:peptidylprolyl isomerase [Bacteroidales bacterium]
MKGSSLSIKCLALMAVLFLFQLPSMKSQNTEVLMTIGGNAITVEDFLSVYYKNNIKGEPIDKSTLEEYLNLFINFKLKVKEAESMGLDTVQEFRNELLGYRRQLAQTLLTDKDVVENLVREAYDRMGEDIRASHILIRVDQNAPPSDTLAAYNKILNLRTRILRGESFESVAMEASDDLSARDSEATDRRPAMKGNKGDLGYFSALDMVYPFETGAYSTPVGQISMPIRTNFGYHLIKVTDKRKAMGRAQVAHILISMPQNADETMIAEKRRSAEEIYQKLLNGESFEDLAKLYSDDKGSGAKGGVLPWFGVNRMVPEFIVAISDLRNIGDVSGPIRTLYGFHIIKLLDKKEVDTFDALYPELKSRVSRDPRANLSKEVFIARVKSEYGFTENRAALSEFYSVVDDSVFFGKWDIRAASGLRKELFKIGSTVFSQQDFAEYIVSGQSPRTKENIEGYINSLYKNFVDDKCTAYEDSRLEEKNPEFKALMKEYRDGILLFELTDQKVWSKAIKDSTGLEAFYETVKQNYMWPVRLNASIFICRDLKVAKTARKMALKAQRRGISFQDVVDKINLKNADAVKVESNFYSRGDSEIIDGIEWVEGISNNINVGNDIVFVVVNEVLQPMPKELHNVRGLIIAEYQNYLESQWINELREKYPVIVNTEVFSNIR